HLREVLEGFRAIQRYALSRPLKGRLAIFRIAIDHESRNRTSFRTSQGFRAIYTVNEKAIGFVHTISAKSKNLPLEDQIESVLFILLELNRQFAQAKIEM